MGKRKVLSESELKEFALPQGSELLGRVMKLPGGDHVIVKCTDDKVRVCRIRGKMKRKMWVRENDVVLVVPWDFQDAKADIIWRYISAHARWLENKNYIRKE
ncbi:MAG: translation initiation factor 1A [Thaumarchaeota archaeon]|nr:translation initiation factor 1A [Nitrososphaerota archaeon]|tara:strand:- start:622 stop:927 length:306 start_codon:yes stop_codon:yes gene_type:complete